MKYFVIIKSVIAAILLSVSVSYGQQVVATSGGQFNDANYDLSWTIGEPLTSTLNGNENIITQGFNQSKLVISGVYTKKNFEQVFSVYPNPVESDLILDIGRYNNNIRLMITNTTGETILKTDINSDFKNHSFDFSPYQQGVYFMHLINSENELMQTFKIVKY